MAQWFGEDFLGEITITSTKTLSIGPSNVRIGGLSYKTPLLELDIDTVGFGGLDSSVQNNSLYNIFFVLDGNIPKLIGSLDRNLTGYISSDRVYLLTVDSLGNLEFVGNSSEFTIFTSEKINQEYENPENYIKKTSRELAVSNWTSRTSAADNTWYGVTYGNNLFVAVASSGSGNRVMTSPDGINWTSRTSAADNDWRSVTYGNNLFVAVSISGTGDRVMTSPDGINWTSRTSVADNSWTSVTYGNGMFVVVSFDGTGDRVMTSPDGINWTSRTSVADNSWTSVTYDNGLFVAVASSGSGNRVMTSPDGINWTSRTSAANNDWFSVTYGNGLFVSVASTGVGNRVMTCLDSGLRD